MSTQGEDTRERQVEPREKKEYPTAVCVQPRVVCEQNSSTRHATHHFFTMACSSGGNIAAMKGPTTGIMTARPAKSVSIMNATVATNEAAAARL